MIPVLATPAHVRPVPLAGPQVPGVPEYIRDAFDDPNVPVPWAVPPQHFMVNIAAKCVRVIQLPPQQTPSKRNLRPAALHGPPHATAESCPALRNSICPPINVCGPPAV